MDTILEYNKQGFIPGPNETKEAFLERVAYCKNLKNHLQGKLPFDMEGQLKQSSIDNVLNKTSDLYDICPNWVPVFKSRFRLPPWHAACAWIFQMDEASPTAAFVQIRKNRQEPISHELCHVARMMFDDPEFEEQFAYMTSKSRFRKTLGPLVQSSWESTLFVVVMLSLIVLDFFLIPTAVEVALWLKLIPLGLVGYAIFRLYKNKRVFTQAKEKVKSITDRPLPFLFRMTAKEIHACLKMSPENLKHWVEDLSKTSPRGIVLKSYLKK